MMRKYMAIFICFFLCGPAFAQEMEVKKVDASGWPVVKVFVELPGGLEPASAYQLKILNPEVMVKDSGVQELDFSQMPSSTLIVLDTGGQFGKNNLETAKAALALYADMFARQESIALLSFAAQAELLSDFTQDPDSFMTALEKARYGGERSDTLQALEKGVKLLENRSGEKTLLVLTSGLEKSASQMPGELLQTANEKKIRVLSLDVAPLSGFDGQISSLELWDLGIDSLLTQRISESSSQMLSVLREIILEKEIESTRLFEITFDLGDELLVNPAAAQFSARLCAQGKNKNRPAPLLLDVSEAAGPYPGLSVRLISGLE